jgi:predicted dehydrogenase
MTRPVRIGLIGVGGIGSYHRKAIEAQEAAGRCQLVAVTDPYVERLAAEKAELESRGVRWHVDYQEMLRQEPDLDAVVIATPIPYHYEMTMASLERGLTVHLEKPPVPLIQQLDALIAADVNRTVSVGFQFIGSRCTRMLKQLIADGALGQVLEIRAGACWPRMDDYYSRAPWAGRMMMDSAPVFDGPATNALAHLVHNLMYLAGDGRDEFAIPVEARGELYRARPIESYDTACMRGRFESGIEFSMAVTHATETAVPFRIEVRGAKGWGRLSRDGLRLDTSVGVACDHQETTQQLIDINHANFIDVIQGRNDRYFTRLIDTRGYVSTTNLMLLSSGGVHDNDPASIRRFQHGDRKGVELLNLSEAVEETIASGQLFTEQGRPWATAEPKLLRLSPSQATPLADFLSRNGAAPDGVPASQPLNEASAL